MILIACVDSPLVVDSTLADALGTTGETTKRISFVVEAGVATSVRLRAGTTDKFASASTIGWDKTIVATDLVI